MTRHIGLSNLTRLGALESTTAEPAAMSIVDYRASHKHETNALRAILAKKKDERTELRRHLEAATTVIATPHHENTALRAQLNRRR